MNLQPEYIFETSWEVCNRVGGIYAVLSTRAASMQADHPEQVVFFGPDLGDHSNLYFHEDKRLLRGLIKGVRVGRWLVPGNPIAVLVKWEHLRARTNELYGWAWEKFGVQSHAAYGDYEDSCLFAYAVGEKMAELYKALGKPLTAVHCNEWQTAFTLFYIKEHCPKIATLFTTHATGIGRSIAGNGKPLYDYFTAYNGDQMASELGMVSKHSIEKQAAHHADCFTTVSDLTARECAQLLDKPVDIVTPNGFEQQFVPKARFFNEARQNARKALCAYAQDQMGEAVEDNAMLLCIAGRLEWKNKGIDVFLEAMKQLGSHSLEQQVIAFVLIPYLSESNIHIGNVHVIFVPHYLPILHSQCAISGMSYYDLLIGMDLSVFPSYYEPWGYTPLESVAFHVPTITTTLAGFGLWAQQVKMAPQPVCVIARNDSNQGDVVNQICQAILRYMALTDTEKQELRKQASSLSKKADWHHFFPYYRRAYAIALQKITQ